MFNSKRLFFVFLFSLFISEGLLFFSVVKAEDAYVPPTMFSSKNPAIVSSTIKPMKKPPLPPFLTIRDVKKTNTIKVSTSVERARSIKPAKVQARSLVSSSSSSKPYLTEDSPRSIDLTIGFLPSSLELTKMQKRKFEEIIRIYFLEQEAKTILVKIYASSPKENQIKNSKRKALARGLSIREWLVELGIRTDQIQLKTIGISEDETALPDRADIQIIY